MLTFQHSSSTLSFDENRRMCVTLYGRKADGKSVKVVVRNLTAYGFVSGNIEQLFQANLNRMLQWYRSMNLTERSAKKFKREEGYEKPDDEVFRSWDTYWWNQCQIHSTDLIWTQTKGHNIRNVKDGPGPVVHKFATQKNDIWRAVLSIFKDFKGTHEKIKKFRQKMYNFADGKSVRSVPKLIDIPLQLYETMFNPEIVWMVDNQLPACSWMTCKACSIMDESFGDNWYNNVGYCDLNVTCDHNQVIPCESPPAALAPFRVLSYDIEATPYVNPITNECEFPDPKRDSIITIGVCAFDMVSAEMVQTVFMLEYEDQPRCTSLAPLPSPTDEYDPSITTVHSFTDELEMLEAFAAHIKTYDPEIITGYNVLNFDNVYLIRRIQALCGCGEDNPYCTSCSGARTFSRVERPSVLKKKYTHSKQRGGQESWEAWIEGRDWMDIYRVVIADHKLRSYKLDNVCLELLGTQKMPIAYDDIPKHQTTPEGREFLAQYCVKDAWLPCQIIVKRCKVINAIQMAQVTGVLLTTILHRGQQIRTMLLMLKQIKERCRQNADHPRWFLPDESNSKRPTADGFEGAVVITPKPGYYQTPVVTLDFASLYPSIMRAYNMCFSTLIPSYTEAQKQGLKWSEETQMIKDPADPNYPEMRPIRSFNYPEGGDFEYVLKKTDVCFHTSTKRYGILPEILHQLLNERSRVKKLRKKYGEKSMDYAVLDGRQLALKVCANSVYGFTGAGMGYLGEKRIASSVTRVGRGMANHTKYMCEEKYKDHGLEIVYGDTDSVFANIPASMCDTNCSQEELIAKVDKIGIEMGQYCTQAFLPPNDLEYEKFYYPILLKGKKRYAGHKFEPGLAPKLDVKGFECIRRDFAPLVNKTQKRVLELLCKEGNVQGAIDYTRSVVVQLLQNEIPLELLTMSKQLTRRPCDYKNPSAHVNLAQKLMDTQPAHIAPKPGDRIEYCIRPRSKGEKTADLAVTPEEVRNGTAVVDTRWILSNQLRKPMQRIFEMVMKNSNSIFAINSIRNVHSVANPMMSNFITATARDNKRKAPEESIQRVKLKKSKTTIDLTQYFTNC